VFAVAVVAPEAGAADTNISLATVLSRAADKAPERAVSEFDTHAFGAGRSDLAATALRWAARCADADR
jgi:hypothetical protein